MVKDPLPDGASAPVVSAWDGAGVSVLAVVWGDILIGAGPKTKEEQAKALKEYKKALREELEDIEKEEKELS